ncbi:unnamed protein product [Cladocopium goreaui]|uniref:Uncharacterized protein n=1 Tax=Cladocopium goreaui TaxID=2562237 RepID=A0A9P1BHN8_9DINO|nr:unnamed protein product [Cladocopium goreaui]
MTTAGLPQSFCPAAPGPATSATSSRRVRSNVPLPRRRAEEPQRWLDPIDLQPTAGKRWLVPRGDDISVTARREALQLLERKHFENDFSGWQMPFPFELPCGEACPICSLGECGDVNCPSYRPKRHEVRQAVEETVLQHAVRCFAESGKGINTYVSVGAGLLAQDWIILEKLRAAELPVSRVVVVDLRTAEPVIACEGRKFSSEEGGLDLCQLGYHSEVGPEFSFSAVINFEGSACYGSRLFDFCNGIDEDNIYVDVVSFPEDVGAPGVGGLIFGVRRGEEDAQVAAAGAWVPQQPHLYLFTVSASGMMRIYIDGQLAVSRQGHPPERLPRKRLYVGQSSASQVKFCGEMRKIQVWNHCVDSGNVDGLYTDESARALKQFARWFAKDLSVYSFGTLASYAAAVAEDSRFQADLMLQIDVHEEIDGYDDVAKKVLSPQGVALTLVGPGRSWQRQGNKVVEIEVGSETLSKLESRKRQPWVFYGPGKTGRDHFCSEESRYLRLSGWARRLRSHAGRRHKA